MDRRMFLGDLGLGFAGLALGSMLGREARGQDLLPHRRPKARSVIWIFLSGGYSHLETFDPKPALNKYAGKSFDDTPVANPLKSPLHEMRSRNVVAMEVEKRRPVWPSIYPMQVGFKKYGQSGIEVSDWLPRIGSCVDDIAFVRSMYTTDNDHAAENQIHTGRHRLDGDQPSLGAWVTYGLGTMNENLPQYVVLGGPTRPDSRPSVSA